jgi:hypothetical protein
MATQNGDFKLATRLLYLRTLKNLNARGEIVWEPEKTNSQYVKEIKNTNRKQAFRSVSRLFEYSWYGSFHIDQQTYSKIDRSFADFNATSV